MNLYILWKCKQFLLNLLIQIQDEEHALFNPSILTYLVMIIPETRRLFTNLLVLIYIWFLHTWVSDIHLNPNPTCQQIKFSILDWIVWWSCSFLQNNCKDLYVSLQLILLSVILNMESPLVNVDYSSFMMTSLIGSSNLDPPVLVILVPWLIIPMVQVSCFFNYRYSIMKTRHY